MAKFKRKPAIIEAEQFKSARIGQDTLEWIRAFPKGVCFKGCNDSQFPHVHTIHDGQTVDLVDGDWVAPEPDGEHFYPIKDDIFKATYESLESVNG